MSIPVPSCLCHCFVGMASKTLALSWSWTAKLKTTPGEEPFRKTRLSEHSRKFIQCSQHYRKWEVFLTSFVEGKQTLLRIKTSQGSSNTTPQNLQPIFQILGFFPTTIHICSVRTVGLFQNFNKKNLLGDGNFNQTASFAQDKDHRFNICFTDFESFVLKTM